MYKGYKKQGIIRPQSKQTNKKYTLHMVNILYEYHLQYT